MKILAQQMCIRLIILIMIIDKIKTKSNNIFYGAIFTLLCLSIFYTKQHAKSL